MSTKATMQPTTLAGLEKAGVRFVRVTWVDFIGFVRYRVVPIAHFQKLVCHGSGLEANTLTTFNSLEREETHTNDTNTKTRILNPHGGIQMAKAAFGLVFLTLASGFTVFGEYVYAPDLSSARLLPFAPGHASVFGWFEEKDIEASVTAASPLPPAGSFRAALCPRELLRKIVADAKKTDSVDFLIGVETEVIFLNSVDPIVAVNDYGWSVSPAICAGSPEARALEEIADALELAGIELQMYHAEAAPGQYEIVTGPLPPLEACDALIVTREIIMNIAARHGMRATLAPRVFNNSCGSAAHTHISLKSKSPTWASTQMSNSDVPMSSLESAFLAGLLAHLPAAMAFTLPTRASYARMVDGIWTGGTWVAWGRDNREAPVRLCGRGGKDVHFEVKSVDGTACAYLAVAALLVAGMSGVRARAKLAVRGLEGLASDLSEEGRRERGITTRMPLTIEQAREALEGDRLMKDTLGEELVKSYLSANKTLNEELEAPTPNESMIKVVRTF